MDLVTSVIIVVVFLVIMEFVFSSTFFRLLGRAMERIRLCCGRRIPVGTYRFDSEIGIGFGTDDATLILRLPVQDPGARHPVRYIGVTDASTRFTVRDEGSTPDGVLEAYDDSIGPLRVTVYEPGKIAELGITDDAR